MNRFLPSTVLLFFCLLTGVVLPAQHNNFQNGDLFLGQGAGVIQWRDANGVFIKKIITGDGGGNGSGTGLRIHPHTGKLWVTNSNLPPNSPNGLRIINTDGTPGNAVNVSAWQNGSTSVTFDSQGNAYVGHLWSNGEVVKVDPSGTTVLDHYKLSTDGYIWGPEWVEMDCNDSILYYTNLRAKIKRYNVVTRQQLPDFADLSAQIAGWLFAMRLLPDGTMLVVAADNVVLRLNAAGHIIQTYTPSNPCGLFGMAATADGNSVWAGGLASNGPMYKFDIATGTVQKTFLADSVLPGINIHGIAVYGDLVKNCIQDPMKNITGIQIRPNPGNGRFKLQTSFTGSLMVRVINGLGLPVYNKALQVTNTGQQVPLDLYGLPAGIYFVRITGSTGAATQKIVIQ